MITLRCDGCGFVGDADDFLAAMSVYHDFQCSKRKTTNVDTHDLNAAWAAEDLRRRRTFRRKLFEMGFRRSGGSWIAPARETLF